MDKIKMGSYEINLDKQTATSINGITFKLSKTEQGEYKGVCLNPEDIPPDDMDDEILARMIKEAWVFYELAKKSR